MRAAQFFWPHTESQGRCFWIGFAERSPTPARMLECSRDLNATDVDAEEQMAAAWISCPQCRLFFQREATQSACPGCGSTLPPPVPPGWFYVRDKKRLGPVPQEELKALA